VGLAENDIYTRQDNHGLKPNFTDVSLRNLSDIPFFYGERTIRRVRLIIRVRNRHDLAIFVLPDSLHNVSAVSLRARLTKISEAVYYERSLNVNDVKNNLAVLVRTRAELMPGNDFSDTHACIVRTRNGGISCNQTAC
jgi:hypothetical protein